MKFDFNKPLVLLNGKTVKDPQGDDLTMAKNLAANMANVIKSPEPQKLLLWAMSLEKDGTVTLDKVDQAKFKKQIETFEGVSALVQGRLLDEFEEQQEADKKPKLAAVASSNGEAQTTAEPAAENVN